jgi:nicotinamidase-related amidase
MGQTALLVIDVQKGLFKMENKVYNEEMLLCNINLLIDKSRERNIPVIFIRHANGLLIENTENWNIHSAINIYGDDLVLNKACGSIFDEKSIVEALEQREITNLIVTGLVTHGCIKTACLDAKKFGYEVTLAEDAHSNFTDNPKALIEEWNLRLLNEGVNVTPTMNVYK